MNSFLLFLLKSTLSLSILYLAFNVLMRKETFFRLNRMLLLLMVIISVVIPFMYAPQLIQPSVQVKLEPVFQNTTILEESLQKEVTPTPIQLSAKASNTNRAITISPKTILLFVYLFGVFISLMLLLYNLASILVLFQKARKINQNGLHLRIVSEDVPAFSFGKYILISQYDYDLHSETIITHEQSHIRLGHFYDLMLMELTKIIFWFNPLVYRMVSDMKEIHEFQADDCTLHQGIDATYYQLLIIQKCVGHQKFALANSFNHCQIKNRITMMNKQKTSKARSWKVATFLPLLALLLIYCGRNGGNELPNFDRCEITNISMCCRSKFSIELSVDKFTDSSDTAYYSNPKNLVYLVVTSKNSTELADGEYRFTSFPQGIKDSMTFTGIFYNNKIENKIIFGNIAIKKTGDKVSISYQLHGDPAYSKNTIAGSYYGSYSTEDRSIKTEDATKFSSEDNNNGVKNTNPSLSIETNNDGNFINKQRCSLYGIVKKAEVFRRKSPLNQLSVTVSSYMGIRSAEIFEILGLANPIPNRTPQFRVVPNS